MAKKKAKSKAKKRKVTAKRKVTSKRKAQKAKAKKKTKKKASKKKAKRKAAAKGKKKTAAKRKKVAAKGKKAAAKSKAKARRKKGKAGGIDHFINTDGLDSEREKTIGQHIGYRYDVNLVPDYSRITPFLTKYIETMGWSDLNWLEDVHMGYEENRAAVFDRNINGWVTVPAKMKLPNNQQDRDMIARELLIKFQMSPDHPMVELNKAYAKF